MLEIARNILRVVRKFTNPAGEADERPAAERPLLRRSLIFTLLVGLFASLALTGFLSWISGMTRMEIWQHSALVWHLFTGPIAALLFFLVVKNHIRSIFGPWRGRWFLLVYFGIIVVFFEIHLPIWQLCIPAPIAVFLLLRLALRKPRARVEAGAVASGAFAATAWWAFLFASCGLYFMKEEFYIRYPTLHVTLAVTAFASLLFHLCRAGHREAPGGIPFRKRMLVISILCGSLLFLTLGLRDMRKKDFAANPESLSLALPVHFDTSKVRAGKPLTPDPRLLFEESSSCSANSCHPEIYRQWSISSHHYAASFAPYRKMIDLVYKELGPERTLFCSKCHAPLLAILGLVDNPADESLNVYRAAGITCQYCHVIREAAASKSNGDFLLQFDRRHLFGYTPLDERSRESQRNFILHNLSRHRKVYPARDPRKEEYCVGCHRVVVPPEFAGGRQMILGDLHTPFISSQSAAEGISCSDCHMPLATYWHGKVHARPDHRMLGTNNAATLMVRPPFAAEPDLDELGRDMESFLYGNYFIPDYEVKYLHLIGHKKYDAYLKYMLKIKKIAVSLQAPKEAVAGSSIIIAVKIENRTGAHVIPSGPFDLNEYWIELKVTSGDGQEIFASGALGADKQLTPNTVVIGGVPLDETGRPIEHHRFWNTFSVKDKLTIPIGGERTLLYQVPVPAEIKGALRVSAFFRYRRYNQKMADWIYQADGTTFPIYTYDSSTAVIDIVSPADK